jgi:hypothetical protein
MPTSDLIFATIGAVDFLSILGFILWTGFVTHKETASRDKKRSETNK